MTAQLLSRASLAGVVLAVGLSLSSPVSAQSTNGGRVFGIHLLTLKPGADVKAFEACMTKQAEAWKGVPPGMQLYVMKGDRGEQSGQYMVVYEFDSAARRAEYYPTVGGPPSARAQEFFSKIPDMKCETHLVADAPDHYTDFVVLQ